jgi:hypothetical protein
MIYLFWIWGDICLNDETPFPKMEGSGISDDVDCPVTSKKCEAEAQGQPRYVPPI